MTTALAAIPNAVDLAYRFWLWIGDRAEVFPRGTRHGTGARMVDLAESIMASLVRATYAKRGSATRGSALAEANVDVAVLRLLVRGCRERKLLSVSQYDHATEQLVTLGKGIGAWLRAANPTERSEAP